MFRFYDRAQVVSRQGFFCSDCARSVWVGGFLRKWPTTNFWLLHAAFALGSGLCFVLFKFVVQRHLTIEDNLTPV
jgi:hypothetical protein